MVKVLIVEDDQDINNMLKELLRLNQIDSVCSFSGTETLLAMDDSIDLV
ncbi:hypothetical protein [Thomasclavelia sp.]